MMRKGTAWALLAFTFAVLVLLFVWPLSRIIRGGLYADGRLTGRYVAEVFSNPIYLEGLLNSMRIAAGTTALAALIAIPLARLAHRFDFPGKQALGGMLLVPMVLPPFVGAVGLQQMLGPYGALNALLDLGPFDWLGRGGMAGIVILQALSLYPILYLNTSAAMANVDPAMEEAAENLGCAGLRKFRRVTLPLIAPGLFAGATLVFIWSFTELGTPLILNYPQCAPVQVYDALKDIGGSPFPYALVCVILAWSIALYLLARLAFGRKAHAMQARASLAYAPRRLRGWRSVLVFSAFASVVGLALVPHVGVILTSVCEPGSWYQSVLPARFTAANYAEALGHDMTVGSIRNSLGYAVLATGANLVLGLTIALVVVRSDLRLRTVLDAMAMAPLAVPGLVMAFAYLSLSSELSNLGWVRDSAWLAGILDVRNNPTLFLVIAYATRRLPYVVRACTAGLQQTSVAFEESAANLGARPFTVVRRITLPLISANVVAGLLLAFAFSMLEVSDSLMLAQRTDYFPITKAIYELFQLIGTGRFLAAALGTWAMAFLAMTLVAGGLLLGRRMGVLFRV